MFGLFGSKERIICPRCLGEVRADVKKPVDTTCPSCKYIIPLIYIRDYAKALPVYIQMFGWSQTGKSTFLDVLRLHLYSMENIWPRSFAEPVSEIDFEHRRILLTERNDGKPPGATPKKSRDQTEVYLMKLNDMERWNSRFLVIMDHAGELFETFGVPVNEIPFLKGTPTAIMLISLPDMHGKGRTFIDVITVYKNALERYGVNFNKDRRRLIIVLAKADLISNLPANINEYLQSDDLGTILPPDGARFSLEGLTLAEYLERMGRVSNAVKEWIDNKVEGGRAGLRMLEKNNIDARFVVMSSIGQDIGNASGVVRLAPRRVLDPFFWALEFQSRER